MITLRRASVVLILLVFATFVASGAEAAEVITINFTGGLTLSQQAIFTTAEATWESVILGYLPGATAPASLVISATGAPIDGPGGILGSAGPTTATIGASFIMAASGAMTFDSADLLAMETAGTLLDVITHEMGHVIGIGTLWSSSGVGLPGFQEVYSSGTGQYTGAMGLATWRTEFNQPGATFVPIELGGNPGTTDSHWNENDGGAGTTGITQVGTGLDFRNELMTGWLNAPTFLSQMTIDSLEDIGYDTLQATPIPEPSTFALAGLGLFAIYGVRRRKKRGAKA